MAGRSRLCATGLVLASLTPGSALAAVEDSTPDAATDTTSHATPPVATSGSATYTVTVAVDSPDVLRVEATLPAGTAALRMSDHGAHHLDDGWAEFVQGLEARSSDGVSLPVEKTGPRSWAISGTSDGPITIAYEVRLEHDPDGWPGGIDGAAYTRDWGSFFTGRAVFIVPSDGIDGTIDVSFGLPSGWHASTPWDLVYWDPETFRLRGDVRLLESIVFVGDHHSFEIERDGFVLAFALGGESVVARGEELWKEAEAVFDFYIEQMGGPPRPAAGEELTRILVVVNESDHTDGEVIGSQISMLMGLDPSPIEQAFARLMFAHELFHLWNGMTIRRDGPEDWFAEGFTNYYTMKALYNVGAIDEEQWFGITNMLLFQRYQADPGLGSLSMRDAVPQKDRHWGLIYGGGFFVALCQDVAIRTATDNARSVDDLMRTLYARLAGSEDTYTAEDVMRLASELAGTDQEEFYRRHVFGTEPVSVDACLRQVGLDASVEEGQLRVSRAAGMSQTQAAIVGGMLGK